MGLESAEYILIYSQPEGEDFTDVGGENIQPTYMEISIPALSGDIKTLVTGLKALMAAAGFEQSQIDQIVVIPHESTREDDEGCYYPEYQHEYEDPTQYLLEYNEESDEHGTN